MEETALDLLKRLLEIRSVNHADREGDVAEALAAYFAGHHIKSEVQRIDGARANVSAFLPGRDSGKTMIWNGHLDTVPYGSLSGWDTDPAAAVEKDGRVYARGASDMKSGLAAMTFALCHLDKAPACNILFLGTCDEEQGGLGAEEIMKTGLPAGGPILIGEPTGLHLGIAQKGCLWLELKISGKTSHGAYPEEGANAVDCAVRIAGAVSEYVGSFSHALLGASTAQITVIEGGGVPNMTPDSCRLVMDVRMVPGLTSDMVFERARDALFREGSIDPRFHGDFTALNDRRAIEIDSGHPMTAALRELVRAEGFDGTGIGVNFFTDASILDREDTRPVLLFGPGEPSAAHKPNEYVEIEKYEAAVRILQAFAENYA